MDVYHPNFRSEVRSRACDMAMSDCVSFMSVYNANAELTAITLESDTVLSAT
jgi:hypothetical protein